MNSKGITLMTKEQAHRIIAVMSENWNVKFNSLKAEIYGENIADLDYEKCILAIKKLIQTSEFLPTVAVLRREYVNLDIQPLDSAEAYLTLKKAISRHGIYGYEEALRMLKASNLVLYELIKKIGWREICLCPESFLANEFAKALKDFEKERFGAKVLSPKLTAKIEKLRNEIQQAGLKLIESDECDEVY